MAASRRLRELQSQLGNKICVDCSQKNPQWASISYGVFMCLECSVKYFGLGVHISFVRSVTMDLWSEIQLMKIELVGNDRLNQFMVQYGTPKETEIVMKYNTNATSVYRDRIQAFAEGKPWRDPPVVKETLKPNTNGNVKNNHKHPLSGVGNGGRNDSFGNNGGWNNWDSYDDGGFNNNNIRRNNTVGNLGMVEMQAVPQQGRGPLIIFILKPNWRLQLPIRRTSLQGRLRRTSPGLSTSRPFRVGSSRIWLKSIHSAIHF